MNYIIAIFGVLPSSKTVAVSTVSLELELAGSVTLTLPLEILATALP